MVKKETIKEYFENIFKNNPVKVKEIIMLEEGGFLVEVEYAEQSHHIDLDYERALQDLASKNFYKDGWIKEITLKDKPEDPLEGEMFQFNSEQTEYNARSAKYFFKVAEFGFESGN